MAQAAGNGFGRHFRICLRHHQILNHYLKRSSCGRVSSFTLSVDSSTTNYACNRLQSTNAAKASMKAFQKGGLNGFVYSLSDEERDELFHMLAKASTSAQVPGEVPVPTSTQLRYVAFFSGVPFIGFGLLDNTIMLTAGEYIDITFGTWLGITTMAAAAFGNMISDVLGIMTAGFVEQTALKFGLKAPTISLEQMSLRKTKWAANLGRCVGVIIGCVLGMWPLLVFSKEKDADTENSADSQSQPA